MTTWTYVLGENHYDAHVLALTLCPCGLFFLYNIEELHSKTRMSQSIPYNNPHSYQTPTNN
jgi:hypothetical protein